MAINKKGDESKALKCEYSLPKVAMIKKGMFDGGIQRTASSMYGSANVTMGPSFFYSPELTPESWLLPKSRQEVLKWVKIFYNLEPLVGSITDMHAKYPFSTFKFHCNDKRALEIFNDAFFNLDFNWVQFIYQMSLSYHKYGEAICWGNWNNANKRWDSFICIEPDLMDIKEDPFTGVKSYELIPTIEIKNMVKNSLLKGHTENLPEVLIDSIVNNNKIPLDGDGIPLNNKDGAPYEPPKIFTIARITDPGSTRGTSPIQRLFKCFTGDTKIFLLDGTIQTLESLYKANKEDFWVYSVDDKNNIIPAKAERVIYAGEESVIEVTLDNGEKIECTGDHKFILRDGRECSAQDLLPDMALMPLYKTFLPLGQYGTRRSKYEKIYNPSSSKWEWTHVKVALSENREQFKLRGSRVIHHVDFDSHNNTPENLQVISRDEHAKIHTVSFVSRERMREISKLGLIARNKDDKQSKRMKELWGNFQYRYKVSEKQRQRYANMSVEAKKHLSNNIREGQKDYLNNKYSIIIEKTKKITAELFIKYNRLPTYTEVSRELNVCPITVYNLIRRFGTAPLGIEPIKTRKEYLNHKVVAIRNLNKKAPVYCLGNVGKYHNFAIATDNNSGVFVKNCLIFQDKIRLAQIAIADRHHLPIELWTVGHLTGDPKTTILPDEATLNNIREMIRAATTTPPFSIVYSPLLKYEALSVSGKLLSIYEDLGYVENQILIGMGVNKNLILSEGSAFTSSKTIALHRIIMEYQTVRDLFTETIRKNILLPIAIANDLRDANGRWIVPEIHWDKSLDPEKDKEEREFYLKLWEKGLCSTRTLYSKLPDDFIYEDEQRLLVSEINTIFDKKDKRLPQMNLDPLSLAVTPDVSKQPATGIGASKPSTSTPSIAPIVPGMPPKTPTKPIEEPKKEEIKPELPKTPEVPVTPPPEKV